MLPTSDLGLGYIIIIFKGPDTVQLKTEKIF